MSDHRECMEALFTYGTLTIPEVMQLVTGRHFASCEAIAPDFACFRIQDRLYPGITPRPGEWTEGRVYLNVDPHSLDLLDLFEDERYSRELITVTRHPGASTINAYAYIISREHQSVVSKEPWNRQHFIETHIDSYLETCRDFHLQLARRNVKPPT